MLEAGPDDLREAVRDAEVVVLRSGPVLSAEVLAAAPGLRAVVRAGSGLDNIDLECARERRIRVVRIAGMSGPPVAELTFALLLALARNVTLADRLIRQGDWPKPRLGGPLLQGKTLGVVGAGNIGGPGRADGARLGHAGARLRGPPEPGPAAEQLATPRGDAVAPSTTWSSDAHFVTLHVPLDESTHHMIDADVLARMRPGSLLVNMARGGVVDEKALYEALTRGGPARGRGARRPRDRGSGNGVPPGRAAERGPHAPHRRHGPWTRND